jgi:hypothetical protein
MHAANAPDTTSVQRKVVVRMNCGTKMSHPFNEDIAIEAPRESTDRAKTALLKWCLTFELATDCYSIIRTDKP